MSLGSRNPRTTHRTAGVDPTTWHDFVPGQRVLTVEGLPGVVADVHDGPHPGSESYEVVLDHGLGGGEYGPGELTAAPSRTTAKTASSATPANPPSSPFAQHVSDTCTHCGEAIIFSVSVSKGSAWVHSGTGNRRCSTSKTAAVPIQRADGTTEFVDSMDELEHRTAADDYPELSEILIERPPLEHAIPVTGVWHASKTAGPRPIPSHVFVGVPPAYQLCDICDRGRKHPSHIDVGATLQTAAVSLQAEAGWQVVDSQGNIHAGPFENSYRADEALSELRGDPEVEGEGLYVQRSQGYSDTMFGDDGFTSGSKLASDEGVLEYPKNFQPGDVIPDPLDGPGRTVVDIRFAKGGVEVTSRAPDGSTSSTIYNGRKQYRIIRKGTLRAAAIGGRSFIEDVGNSLGYQPGRNPSYDWCRFRREQHCWYPKHLNVEATKAVGYAVWIPEDRGYCPHNKWDEQKGCPVSAPGPRSGDPNAQPDATIAWEAGGQRESSVTPVSITTNAALSQDPEFRWHFHSAWKDVQSKAKRIRSEGGVRIISSTSGYVTAEVKGDSNIYQTTIMRVPGKKTVAMWECGCAWANYSWARSGRWKKYEGRMCAHALALNYEAGSQEWGGGQPREQTNKPSWRNDPTVPVVKPGDSRTKPAPWRVGSLVVAFDVNKDPWSLLEQKLVDFKGDRPLRDEEVALDLRLTFPDIRWTVYSKVPFFEALMAMQGSDPIHDQVEKLVEDRDSLFGKVPTVDYTIDRSTLVFTQPTVNGPKVKKMLDEGVDGGSPAFIIRYKGSDYLMDGHHRFVACLLEKCETIQAAILDLDESAITDGLTIGASIRSVAMPPIGSNPTIEEIVDWYTTSADRAEPKVSRDVQYIANAEGGVTAGFVYREKSRSSLMRKVKDRMGRPGDPRTWIKDALRYTITFHPAEFSKSVQDALYRFEEKGYKVLAGENSWARGDSYSGLHYDIEVPGDGIIIELQFHTAESFLLKNKKLHKLYEEFRDNGTPLRRRQELFDVMTKYWDEVEIPKEVLDGFPEHVHYMRPAASRPSIVDTDPSLSIAPAAALSVEAELMARVDGQVAVIESLVGLDQVRLTNGRVVSVDDVVFPTYHPTRGITSSLDAREAVGPLDTPVSDFDMVYDPTVASRGDVIQAKSFGGWKNIPVVNVSPPKLYATEQMVSSRSINKVVSGGEPLRPGYYPYVLHTADNKWVVIDGHHRVGMDKLIDDWPFEAHVLDLADAKVASVFPLGPPNHASPPRSGPTKVCPECGSSQVHEDVGSAVCSTCHAEWSTRKSASESGEYELLPSTRGKQLTHVGTTGQPRGLCGTTVAALDTHWVGYMDAMAQVTCPRCADILRAKTASLEDEYLFDGPRAPDGHGSLGEEVVATAGVVDDAMQMLSEGYAAGEVDAHRVSWYAPDEVGQTLASEDVGPSASGISWTENYATASVDDALLFEAGEGELHDEPEPALPETTGDEESDEVHTENLTGIREESAYQVHTTAQADTTTTAPAWLAPGATTSAPSGDSDIAAMARKFLKMGARAFSPAEQAAFINEGQGVRAANLDLLDIAGTHYEALAALDEEDDGWL